MRVNLIIIISLFFLISSCKKEALNNISGDYNVEGLNIRCSYYFCDTSKIKSVLKIIEYSESYVSLQIYDSVNNVFSYLQIAELVCTNSKEIIFSSESKNLVTIINRQDKSFMYRASFNAYNINLEDTSSRYLILNGYKQ